MEDSNSYKLWSQHSFEKSSKENANGVLNRLDWNFTRFFQGKAPIRGWTFLTQRNVLSYLQLQKLRK